MSQVNAIKLECTACKTANYRTRKNKKVHKDRIELKKHCRSCSKHVVHKESK